jgi:hypothetical protein
LQHYRISTWDYCADVLTSSPPNSSSWFRRSKPDCQVTSVVTKKPAQGRRLFLVRERGALSPGSGPGAAPARSAAR